MAPKKQAVTINKKPDSDNNRGENHTPLKLQQQQ